MFSKAAISSQIWIYPRRKAIQLGCRAKDTAGDISFLLRCVTIINVKAIGKADNRPAENDNPVGVWWFKEVKNRH